VLLLVVLSLLILFLMIGTAFIITAKQSQIAAKTATRAAEKAAAQVAKGDLLDEALLQLVRDTNNPNSAMQTHSLLGDKYGNDGFRATIGTQTTTAAGAPADIRWAESSLGNNDNITAGQLVQFELTPPVANDANPNSTPAQDLYGQPYPLSKVDGAYNGQEVTFLSAGVGASAKGVTTRIVNSRAYQRPNESTLRWQFTVMTFPLADGSLLLDPTQLAGSRILVNGRPFNGTGVGLNAFALPATPAANTVYPRLNAAEDIPGVTLANGALPPVALLPNAAFFLNPANINLGQYSPGGTDSQQAYFGKSLIANPASPDWTGRGGADESYDAVDYQNMALALMPDNPIETVLLDITATPNSLGLGPNQMVLPSFHRPALINFWQSQLAAAGNPLVNTPQLLRRVLLRPNWLDHPSFDGSNPEFAAVLQAYNPSQTYNGGSTDTTLQQNLLKRVVYGPWDVDNDNDGVRDSIWIDAGLPLVTNAQGKLVKPLVAMLVVDLDGRVNVNVHGSFDLADFASNDPRVNPINAVSAGAPVYLANGVQAFNPTTTRPTTPRGVGWGPADISLVAAIGDGSFKSLFTGVGTGPSKIPGRFGRDIPPGTPPPTIIPAGGHIYSYDVMPQIDRFGWPQWGRQMARSTFAMPPDVRARYGTALNAFGQVVLDATFDGEATGAGSLCGDSPYEMPLFAEGVDTDNGQYSADAPFSFAELEPVLRMYDPDIATLPQRLQQVAGIAPRERNRVTTDNWDLPVANVAMPPELTQLLSPAMGVNQITSQAYQQRPPRSAAELLEVRVRQALWPGVTQVAKDHAFPEPLAGDPNDPSTDAGKVHRIMQQILAPELAAGVRLNINRPLGNGRDDQDANGKYNGVVDEPGEEGTGVVGAMAWPTQAPKQSAWANSNSANGITAEQLDQLAPDFANAAFTPLDANNDGQINDDDSLLQRQLLARHLYVTAMTMVADPGYTGLRKAAGGANPPPGANNFDDAALARRVAQWAVNVVDFRDPDNGMTPFVYPLNPFLGWNVGGDPTKPITGNLGNPNYSEYGGVDGNPNTADDTLVWGAERPEMIITQTLAWHDRRSEDTTFADVYPPTEGPDKTTKDSSDPDDDFDQVTRPRPAAFITLYNPWAPEPGASADTHRIIYGGGQAYDMGVDLQRTHNGLADGSPVWRIAVYKRNPLAVYNPQTGNFKIGKTYSVDQANEWDPDDPDPTKRPPVPIDRSFYFTGRDPGYQDDGTAFFADSSKTNGADPITGEPRLANVGTVRPGRYLIVGGGKQIQAGSGIYETIIADTKGAAGRNPTAGSPRRRIELRTQDDPHKMRLMDIDNQPIKLTPTGTDLVQAPSENNGISTRIPGDTSSQCMTDVAILDQATDSTGAKVTRSMSFSEPATLYPQKFRAANWNEANGQYQDATGRAAAIDIPLDGPLCPSASINDPVGGASKLSAMAVTWQSPYNAMPSYLKSIDPVLTKIRGAAGGTPLDPGACYVVIFLQRLANPLLAYNPPAGATGHVNTLPVNPYMTVDRATANLTVFNSRGDAVKRGYEEPDYPYLTTPAGDGPNTNRVRNQFSSYERGYTAKKTNANATPALWRFEAPSGEKDLPPTASSRIYRTPDNQFMRLETALSNTGTNQSFGFTAIPYCFLGTLNQAFQNSSLTGEARLVKPQKPFNWLTWNNRPYLSGNELMLVPRLRSSQLLRSFSDAENPPTAGGGATGWSPYDPSYQSQQALQQQAQSGKADVFNHLQSFFYDTTKDAGGNVQTPPPGVPVRMHRVLDLVGTPSLYTGAQSWLNPQTFSTASTPLNTTAPMYDPRYNLMAPFNNISAYREPGKININTIASPAVYAGLFQDQQDNASNVMPAPPAGSIVHPGPLWNTTNDQFLRSRRGYGGNGPDMLALNSNFPTFFVNPYRDANAADLVPLSQGPVTGPTNMVRDAGVEATLLRSTSATPGTVDVNPLFAAATADAAGATTFNYAERDAIRNPFFRYAPMIRLDNLTTTRSNVYAVWITVGYFDIEQAPPKATFAASNGNLADPQLTQLYNRVYPDGYAFGKEAGLDEAATSRLRGFYIIDRSRPAAFDPGRNNNVENVIRLRRKIE
jgi:hypothetical protein